MKHKRHTVDIPLDISGALDALCGKFKDFSSKQVFILEAVQEKLNGIGSVKVPENVSTNIEEISGNKNAGKSLIQRYNEKN